GRNVRPVLRLLRPDFRDRYGCEADATAQWPAQRKFPVPHRPLTRHGSRGRQRCRMPAPGSWPGATEQGRAATEFPVSHKVLIQRNFLDRQGWRTPAPWVSALTRPGEGWRQWDFMLPARYWSRPDKSFGSEEKLEAGSGDLGPP